MDAISTGPFRVGSFVYRPHPSAYAQTVVCKITFELLPGEAIVAAAQVNVAAFDEHAGAGAERFLLSASDFVPNKPRAEVLVRGSAHAPDGRAVRQLTACLTAAEVDKAISVRGDHHFTLDGVLREPVPFARMPLAWDRAAGGPGTQNPAGIVTGPEARPDPWSRVLVPNLFPVGTVLDSREQVVEPISFGPIAPTWPSRLARLHMHARTWDPVRWVQTPLPSPFDEVYFQSAPPDQWMAELQPDVRIALVHLHPHIPELETRLPRVVPEAIVETQGARSAVALRCDTLLIDSDAGTATLVYRGSVPLQNPLQPGRIVVQQAAGSRGVELLDPRAVSTLVPGSMGGIARFKETGPVGDSGLSASRPVLPFAAEAPGEKVSIADPPTSSGGDLPFRPVVTATVGASSLGRSMRLGASEDTAVFTLPAPGGGTERPPRNEESTAVFTLPAPAAVPGPPPLVDVAFGYTMSGAAPPPYVAEPASVYSQNVAAPPPYVAESADVYRSNAAAPPPYVAEPVSAYSQNVAAPPPYVAEPASAYLVEQKLPPPPLISEPVRAFGQEPEPLRGPALGALSWHSSTPGEAPRVGPFVEEPSRVTPAPAPPAAESAPPIGAVSKTEPPPPEAEGPPAEAPLPLAQYPLERVARIEARIARRPESEAHVREAEGLTAAIWPRLVDHYSDEIEDESRRGKSAKGRAYDAAYVGQIEAERGPVSPGDYGRMIVGIERGASEQVLAGLDIPRDAVIRIQRVWLQRILSDPGLAKEARAAVLAAREAD